jgi:LCP family protein required for cell wall assembly
VAGLAIWAAALKANDYAGDVGRLAAALPTGERPPAAHGALTFLVIGVDSSDDKSRAATADALLLVRVSGDRRSVQVVSLPPSLRSGDSGRAVAKVFEPRDTRRLVGDVESVTGIRIDHVGVLDFPGLQAMTDAVGGVTVDVPAPYSGRGRNFLVGRQQFDGASVLAYLSNQDDKARLAAPVRQQVVIQGLFDRVSELGALSDLGQLRAVVGALTQSLAVDDTLDSPKLVALGWDLRGVGSPKFVTAPTGHRAKSLWRYLRHDSLPSHLDEFR